MLKQNQNTLELKCLQLERDLLFEKIKKYSFFIELLKDLRDENRSSFKVVKAATGETDLSSIEYFDFHYYQFDSELFADDAFIYYSFENLKSLKQKSKGFLYRDKKMLYKAIQQILFKMNKKLYDLQKKLSQIENQLNYIDQEIYKLQSNNKSSRKIIRSKSLKPKKESKSKNILRPPKRGELKLLCSKYAVEFGLKLGDTLKDEDITKVFNKITSDVIKTTKGSVSSTLRDKLGYKKKKY